MNDNVENCCFREVCGVLFKRICSVALCAVIVFVGVYTANDTAFALTGQARVTGFAVGFAPTPPQTANFRRNLPRSPKVTNPILPRFTQSTRTGFFWRTTSR